MSRVLLLDMEWNKFVIEGSSIDFLFKDIFVPSFLSLVDINGRTSPVLSTGLYVLEQRYRVYVYVLYVSRVHTRSVVYTVHSTFLLFPGQCNKWCDDRQYQFHRRKCDRDTHWLGNGKVCSTFHNSIICHIVESIRHFRIFEYLGILSNILHYFVSLNYITNVSNAIIDYIVIDVINCKTFFNEIESISLRASCTFFRCFMAL